MTGFTSLCHSFLRGPRLVKTNPTPLIRMIQQIPPISFHTAPFFLASLVLTDINQNQLLVLVPEDSKHIFHVDAGGNRDLARLRGPKKNEILIAVSSCSKAI